AFAAASQVRATPVRYRSCHRSAVGAPRRRVLEVGKMNTLQAYRTPFDAEPVQCEFLHGCTIAQMLGPTVTQACSVRIGAHEVPRKLWAKVKPKPGQRVEIVIYPQGGDSGKWI